jgi:hypothetical protein
VLALAGRAILALPLDGARLLSAPDRTVDWHKPMVRPPPPTAAETPAWKADRNALWRFVLATFWLGAVAVPLAVRQRGGTTADLAFGAVAGAAAGVIAAASVACVLSAGDAVPRLLLPAASSVGVWVALAVGWWTLFGAAVGGLLRAAGTPGNWTLDRLLGGVAVALRTFGLAQLADRVAAT